MTGDGVWTRSPNAWLLLPFPWLTFFSVGCLSFVIGLYLIHIIGLCYGKYRLYRKVKFNMDASGVSIMKPLLGVDRQLRDNLKSFFTMNYPKYELLFCVHERHDHAVDIVKQLMDEYPAVEARIFYGGENVGLNPKINNMMPAYKNAKYPLIMISDSGIMMRPDALMDMVNSMTDDVALVTQVPYSNDRPGFAGTLEQIYFGTSHARIYLAGNCMQFVCSTGMSSLMRKDALDKCGGIKAFGGVLAEDYFIGVALMKRGWKSAISTHPALQNSADPSVSKFHARIRRWMKLRIAMLPHMMLVEPLQDCFISGLLGSFSAWYLFGTNLILYSVLHCLAWFLCDYALIHTLQNGPLSYSIIDFAKGWVVREGLAPVIYIRALLNPDIKWRNGRFRLHWGGQIKAS